MISLVPAAEPKSFMTQIQKIESFSESSITAPRGQISLDAAVSMITRAEGLQSNGLAE
jgi:hypothetical protein